MSASHQICPLEEATNCRRQALAYLGKPEAPLLMRLAEAFEALNDQRRQSAELRGEFQFHPSP